MNTDAPVSANVVLEVKDTISSIGTNCFKLLINLTNERCDKKIAENIGKKFESNWKSSVPNEILYYRPPDQSQSFNMNNSLRFSRHSPCDCFMYTGRKLYTLELKTIGGSSISFERDNSDKGVIHKHQIESLSNFTTYENVISGFVLDFRASGITYFLHIKEFIHMINGLEKKSFNEKDLLNYCSPIVIEKKKLKVNYRYNIEKFFADTEGLECVPI